MKRPNDYFEVLLKNTQDVKVIDSSIDYKNYIPIDLSSSNPELSKFDIKCAVVSKNMLRVI
jgi:hypothetical protein